jgi:hypothetical protein
MHRAASETVEAAWPEASVLHCPSDLRFALNRFALV